MAVVTAFLADRGRALRQRSAAQSLQIADLDVGVLFLFAISSLGVYAIVMAGWAANNKYTLIGGLRSSAQMFSYELALGLSWVGVILLAGSFRIAGHRGGAGRRLRRCSTGTASCSSPRSSSTWSRPRPR